MTTTTTTIRPGGTVSCHNLYTGITTARKVLAISPSGRKLTLERTDWATGKAVFFYRPTSQWYCNDYASEVVR